MAGAWTALREAKFRLKGEAPMPCVSLCSNWQREGAGNVNFHSGRCILVLYFPTTAGQPRSAGFLPDFALGVLPSCYLSFLGHST